MTDLVRGHGLRCHRTSLQQAPRVVRRSQHRSMFLSRALRGLRNACFL